MKLAVKVVDPNLKIIFHGNTVEEAASFIAGMEHAGSVSTIADIHAGKYSIDAPEELVNPPLRKGESK